MSIIIGIDLGTSGCRGVAIARDDPTQIIATSQTPLSSPLQSGCNSEQDPTLWWDAITQTLRQLCNQIDPSKIEAIAVDGTSSTLLLTDTQGNPLTPALMYNDCRSRETAASIAQIAPANCPAQGASSSLAKLKHLYSHLPPDARPAHALHQADWVMGKLSGQHGISDENNCLKLGYDPITRAWPEWIENLGFPVPLLPRVVPPGTVIGAVDPKVAQSFGLQKRVRIVTGTTDSTAAFIATGASQPGDAVTSLGSTMVLKVITRHPINAPEYGIYSHRLDDLWLTGGASNSGGMVLMKHFSQQQLDEMTPQLQPQQSTGLDYYPLPTTGERFPVHDPDKLPVLEPRPVDNVQFFQAMLEGMARIELQGYRLLAQLGAPYPTTVQTVGGGANNPAWREIRETMLGIPVLNAKYQDAAYGTALLALKGITGQ